MNRRQFVFRFSMSMLLPSWFSIFKFKRKWGDPIMPPVEEVAASVESMPHATNKQLSMLMNTERNTTYWMDTDGCMKCYVGLQLVSASCNPIPRPWPKQAVKLG